MARVTSSSSSGTVSIQDTSGNPLTSTSGSLNVNVTSSGAGGTSVLIYNEVTGVAMGSSQTVTTYTVPIGKIFTITQVNVSSDSIANVEVEFDSSINAKRRIYYTNFNTDFDFNGFNLIAGTVINIIATNNSLNGAATFNSTIQGILE